MTLAKYFRYQLERLTLLLPIFFFAAARIWAQADSTTTLSASATSAAWPTGITLTATVAALVNSLKTSATATLTGVTFTGGGNQSLQAKYPGAANFAAGNSNIVSTGP